MCFNDINPLTLTNGCLIHKLLYVRTIVDKSTAAILSIINSCSIAQLLN